MSVTFADLAKKVDAKKKAGEPLDSAEFINEYNKLDEAARLKFMEDAQKYLQDPANTFTETVRHEGKNKTILTFNPGVYVFQAAVKGEEERDVKKGTANERAQKSDDFGAFSTFNENSYNGHPDGLYGDLTKGVRFDKVKAVIKENAAAEKAELAEAERLKQSANAGQNLNQKGGDQGSGNGTQPLNQKIDTNPTVEAVKAEANFVRDNKVVVVEDTYLKGQALTSGARNAGLTEDHLKILNKVVREHFEDPKTHQLNPAAKNSEYTVNNASSNSDKADILSTLKSYTQFEKGVKLDKLSFEKVQTVTRVIDPAAVEPVQELVKVASDKLSKAGDIVKAHLEQNGVDTKNLEPKKDPADKNRAVSDIALEDKSAYFLAGYVKPLDGLIKQEKAAIADKQAQMNNLVKIGFPDYAISGEAKDAGKGDRYNAKTKTFDLAPEEGSNEKAKVVSTVAYKENKDALTALGLMKDGKYVSLTQTIDGKTETVTADIALSSQENQKKYSKAIGDKIGETLELAKKVEGTTRKVGYSLANASVQELHTQEKLLKTPSELVKDQALDENKEFGNSITGFYNLITKYQNLEHKAISETKGRFLADSQRITHDNKKDLRTIEKEIETWRNSRIDFLTNPETGQIKKDEAALEAINAEPDAAKKTLLAASAKVLKTKIESEKAELEVLQKFPSDFADRGKIDTIVIRNNGQVVSVVPFTTDEEIKYQKKLEEKEIKAAKDKHKTGKTIDAIEGVAENLGESIASGLGYKLPLLDKTKATVAKVIEATQEPALEGRQLRKANKQIDEFRAHLNEVSEAADKYYDDSKKGPKNFEKAVKELTEDLKELAEYNAKDKAKGTKFDDSLKTALDEAAKLGVTVSVDGKGSVTADAPTIRDARVRNSPSK